jgi:hypothetical protein
VAGEAIPTNSPTATKERRNGLKCDANNALAAVFPPVERENGGVIPVDCPSMGSNNVFSTVEMSSAVIVVACRNGAALRRPIG